MGHANKIFTKQKKNIMNKKLEQREKQKCYNCAHMEVKDLKRCPKLVCGKRDNTLVGAMWCKFYKPSSDEVQ